ncbi:MAG: uracil-DNA glycosylase [Proteobacteria bacterium]|nr:uracil-DNA glycosylase [Candidatus Enterousia scatequi]
MNSSKNSLIDLDLSGVKWEISDTPAVMRLNDMRPCATKQTRTATTMVVPPIVPVKPISIETAVSMAARPADLNALIRLIGEFNHPLRGGATNVVLPHLAQNPNGVLIITDIPGSDDDATGNVLSGPAGALLDKMLAAINMGREYVSICPLLFWRTPGGRSATRIELDLSRPFVNRLIEFVNPNVILTLGDLAAMEIGGINLSHAHGTVAEMAGDIKIVPIYHPNYVLLKPETKRDVWNALQEMQNLLKIQ